MQFEKANPKRKRRRIWKIILLTMLIILLLMIGLAAGLGIYIYSNLNIAPAGDGVILQSQADAAILLEQGVSLDDILKDEKHFRFTLEEIEELTAHYMDVLESNFSETSTENDSVLELWKDPPPDESIPITENKIMNFLVIGTDERVVGKTGRTDTIVMITVNTQEKTIVVTSILRDCYVRLSGTNEYNRINAAYVFGGIGGLQNTIYDYFGLEFDNYVKIDFTAFETIINAVGGVEVEVTDVAFNNLVAYTQWAGENRFDPDRQRVEGTTDTYRLNGKQALIYARDRDTGDGDYGRTERQRRVIASMIQKAQNMSFIQLMDFIPILFPYVTTDMSMMDAMHLLTTVGATYSSYQIKTFRIPADGTWEYARINGRSVLAVDFLENRRLLWQLLFD